MCTKTCRVDGCTNEAYFDKAKDRYWSECASCQNNKRLYGITTPERDAMGWDQDWKCKICGTDVTFRGHRGGRKAAVVDHCHTNGHIRGIICHQCNKGLGAFEDNIEFLKAAIKYLQE